MARLSTLNSRSLGHSQGRALNVHFDPLGAGDADPGRVRRGSLAEFLAFVFFGETNLVANSKFGLFLARPLRKRGEGGRVLGRAAKGVCPPRHVTPA